MGSMLEMQKMQRARLQVKKEILPPEYHAIYSQSTKRCCYIPVDNYALSIKRAVKKILYNYYMNYEISFEFVQMITLTCNDDNYKDFWFNSGKHLNLFLTKMRKKYGDIVYIARLERGGLHGRLHYHLLVDKRIPRDWIKKNWVLGFNQVSQIESAYCETFDIHDDGEITKEIPNTVAYIMKYVSKYTSGSKDWVYKERYIKFNKLMPINNKGKTAHRRFTFSRHFINPKKYDGTYIKYLIDETNRHIIGMYYEHIPLLSLYGGKEYSGFILNKKYYKNTRWVSGHYSFEWEWSTGMTEEERNERYSYLQSRIEEILEYSNTYYSIVQKHRLKEKMKHAILTTLKVIDHFGVKIPQKYRKLNLNYNTLYSHLDWFAVNGLLRKKDLRYFFGVWFCGVRVSSW